MMRNQLHTIFDFFFSIVDIVKIKLYIKRKVIFQRGSLIFYIGRKINMKINTELSINNFKDLKEHRISFL